MKHPLLLAASLLCALAASFAAADVPILRASAMSGTWLLDGKVRAVQFNLKPDGNFEYRGYGSQSQGRWNVEGGQVRLRWTKIDAMTVDAKKVTAVVDVADGAFTVGKFKYRKAKRDNTACPSPSSRS